MCKIEVAANKLGSLPGKGDFYHLHIIFTDAAGDQYGLRGGPSGSPGNWQLPEMSGGASRASSRGSTSGSSGSNPLSASHSGGPGPFGIIETYVAPYDPEFIDYPKEGETLPKTTIAEGPEACKKFDEMKKHLADIDQSKTGYNPLGPNSNTTVFQVLKRSGLKPAVPPGVWAPGAEDSIRCVSSCKAKL